MALVGVTKRSERTPKMERQSNVERVEIVIGRTAAGGLCSVTCQKDWVVLGGVGVMVGYSLVCSSVSNRRRCRRRRRREVGCRRTMQG